MSDIGRHRWPVLPAFAVFALLFVGPLAFFLVVSFWRLRAYRLVPDFTLDNYIDVWQEYLHSAIFTLLISLLIAIITTVIGFMIAYLARFRAGRYGGLILFVVLVTLFGGYLVKIYAWKTILGTGGILNSTLVDLGLIDEPLAWLLYSPTAVVITLVNFLLPFAVLPIYGSLRGIDDVPLSAARDLGAGGARVFRDIVLPQCKPGIFAAFAVSFLITAGDYVTPRLVGGTNTFMAGNFIESQFINRLNAPIGSALSYAMLIGCGLVLLLFQKTLTSVLRPR
jgi:spermidine/putrescine transport system permease protein